MGGWRHIKPCLPGVNFLRRNKNEAARAFKNVEFRINYRRLLYRVELIFLQEQLAEG